MTKKRLSREQESILETLKSIGGDSTSREIARKLNLGSNGVAQTLRYLENLGYVRSFDPFSSIAKAKRWKYISA